MTGSTLSEGASGEMKPPSETGTRRSNFRAIGGVSAIPSVLRHDPRRRVLAMRELAIWEIALLGALSKQGRSYHRIKRDMFRLFER